jgi:hypothetical protein
MPYTQIRFKGQLDPAWAEYFTPLRLTNTVEEVGLLEGDLEDQSTLFGILNHIMSLNLFLLSVNQTEETSPDPPQNDNGPY